MKKTFIFGLMAAALGFTACSSEDDLDVNNDSNQKGMVLRATVEQPAESRATFTDNEGVWQFAFTTGDNVFVRNDEMSTDKHWMFTKGAGDFTCNSAIEAKSPVTWYAYFPQIYVYFNQQSGKKEDVANLYALSGTTASTTTGTDGLSITMEPQVAILVIDNQIGSIDINVKTGQNSWVSSLKAKTGEKGFELVTYEGKVSLLTTNTPGIYYIAVPAGVQLAVKNGDKVIRSTGTSGLTAGKYYNLTVAPTTGTATATIDGSQVEVNWVQLWKDGPKFAEYNVGATSVENYGGYYTWGGIFKNAESSWQDDHNSGTDDIATILWGSNWRMPTKEEFDNLLAKCDVKWIDGSTEKYNNTTVTGLLCTGKDAYSSNSVFLPAAGYCNDGSVLGQGDFGYYWSSTPPIGGNSAYCLPFYSDYQGVGSGNRVYGYSVRAVLVEED